MKSTRLPWLLAVMLALLVLRVVAPPRSLQSTDFAQAVARQDRAAAVVASPQRPEQPISLPRIAALENEPDRPGNAFAVRAPKVSPLTPAAAAQNLPTAVVATAPPVQTAPPLAASPVAPPEPRFQIIGTWDDGSARGVFVTTPQGTLLARQGSTLLADYNVVRITGTEVLLRHVASSRDVQLPIPQVSPAAPRP